MRTIRLFKARPTFGEDEESVTIIIDTRLPEITGRNWEHHAQERFKAEASLLADGLLKTLPGGTTHELLIEMLKRKTCLLHVKA
jgi:hypothetical protein